MNYCVVIQGFGASMCKGTFKRASTIYRNADPSVVSCFYVWSSSIHLYDIENRNKQGAIQTAQDAPSILFCSDSTGEF